MALGVRGIVGGILMAYLIVEFLNEGVYFPDEPDRAIVAKDIFDTFNFWDSIPRKPRKLHHKQEKIE